MFSPHQVVRAVFVGAVALALASCGNDGSIVAATINGTEISASDVDTHVDIIGQDPDLLMQLEGLDDGQAQRELQAIALNQLLFEIALRDLAAEHDIEMSDEVLNALHAEIAVQFGDEESMYAELELRGMDRDEVDRQVELFALQDATVSELAPEVSDDDIAGAYDDGAPARHILVAAEDEAIEAIERIESGEDFAKVAEEISLDAAELGGDLGFIQPGITYPEFEDALFGADEGELTGPVETEFGFHVIERLEKPSLADAQDDLREELEQLATYEGQLTFDELISDHMRSADVDVDSQFGAWDAEFGQVVPDQPDDIDTGDLDDFFDDTNEQDDNGNELDDFLD